MKLTFIGAAHEVTGSCTMLQACGKRILIDCGLEQGPDLYENCSIPMESAGIDAVLLTHAHIDHSGKLPVLTAEGFSGPIHCTEATAKLCSIMLLDSAHIQESEAEWRNRRAKRSGADGYVPLYTVKDAENTLRYLRPHRYGETVSVCPGISCRFFNAGHLLGSSSLLLTVTENGITKTLLFSGDLGNPERPLIPNSSPAPEADYVVIESTYGDRLHDKSQDYVSQLAEILRDTFSKGGSVIVPAFAVGRTQELLYLIRIIKERGLLNRFGDFPVYVDSPLAVEATAIYGPDMQDYYDDEARALIGRGINPIGFPSLRFSLSSNDSKAINEDRSPKVILSASGMCEAGRIRHHLKHNLWRAENTVLFVGYQSEGTLGRKLLNGAEMVSLFGEEVAVRARIAQMDGFSSHADRDMLLAWLRSSHAEKIFVNHGTDTVTDAFAACIREELRMDASAPYSGDVFDLAAGVFTEKVPVRKNVTKRKEATQKVRTVYDRLVAAGQRLMKTIEANRGGSNRELGEFADRIDSLCEKYKR